MYHQFSIPQSAIAHQPAILSTSLNVVKILDQGCSMSSSYDERIFERDRWSFAPSQRFSQLCHDFRGAFNLAIQSVSVSVLQRTLPYNLSRMLFFNFIFFSLILGTLLIIELIYKRKFRGEDLNLLAVIKRLLRHEGWEYLVFIIIMITLTGNFIGVLRLMDFQLNKALAYLSFPISLSLAGFVLAVFVKVIILFLTTN